MDTDSFDDNKIYTHQRNHRNEINIPIYISNKTKRQETDFFKDKCQKKKKKTTEEMWFIQYV